MYRQVETGGKEWNLLLWVPQVSKKLLLLLLWGTEVGSLPLLGRFSIPGNGYSERKEVLGKRASLYVCVARLVACQRNNYFIHVRKRRNAFTRFLGGPEGMGGLPLRGERCWKSPSMATRMLL